MALTTRPRGRWWSRLHFLVRFAGLSGLLAAGAGLVLASRALDLSSWQAARDAVRDFLARPLGTESLQIALLLVLGGGVLALVALLVEAGVALRFVAGRRGAFGLNVALQVALATALLVAVNAYSFHRYARWDWTRDRLFTLSDETRHELTQLKGKTKIVVYQRHKTFGQLSDKPDVYDYAAERKVIEKVKDLVEQFQQLGPQFQVIVLDVEEEGYTDKLARETEGAPELRDAIDKAPENSIFFYAGGKVQRLGFHDVYQLDKQASQQANDGRGNLVLVFQGVEPFARKVLNIDEKRPRVAVGVIHELLSLEGSDELGMAGVKKALAARGFDSRDLIFKKWSEFAPPEPAVLTFDESKFERLDEQAKELDETIKDLKDEIQELTRLVHFWKSAPLEELTKKYADQLNGRAVDEGLRRRQLALFEQNVALRRDLLLPQEIAEREAVEQEKKGLNVASLAEQRRISDLKAKTERMLADCDLLILPRMTLFNVSRGDAIPNRVHRLDPAQEAAIQEFLKSGKPVLACFGPVNEPAGRMDPFEAAGPEKLEEMLGELGLKFARQTVLFNVESKSFAERRSGLLILGANVEVPPVLFDWPPGAGLPLARAVPAEARPNPIRESMRLTARGLGKDQTLDLRVRHPRPVYFEPPKDAPAAVDPIFLMTSELSWNDDQPFPTRERTPRFEPSKADDSAKGTLDAKRRGPFPIGVAVETTVPARWYSEKEARPATVRVAALGHGGLFVGPTLSPVKEKLFFDVCNWLLGRDDLLTKDHLVWQYPRVSLSPDEHTLWQWGTRLGLPLVFVYLGLVVLMVRQLR